MKVLNKKYYIATSLVFTSISLALIGLSSLFYMEPTQPVNFDRVKSSAISSCSSSFDGDATYMNLKAEAKGSKVLITAYGLEEWEGKLNMASHIVSSCNGMSMKKLCFGEDCNLSELTGDKTYPSYHTGLFMELEFSEANIDPRVKKDW
jgi:hypothetical protein